MKYDLPIAIPWMIRKHMPEILAIEKAVFEFPWFEDDFIRCLRQRNCIGMTAVSCERVVGYMVYELHKSRLHVLSFCVHPEFRRLDIGTQMIDKLKGKLSGFRRSRIMLETRESNISAQLFWKSQGFRAISVFHDFYEDTSEDAYLFQFRYAQLPLLTEAGQ